jgi:hypothetical protein
MTASRDPTAAPRRQTPDVLVRASLAAYVLLFAVVAALGLRMDVPLWMFQFLPETALRDRFWESLYHLHSQPPMMNTLVGGAIQLERWAGLSREATLLAVHFLAGWAIVRAVAMIAGRLLRRRWLRVGVVAALVLDPCFWLALFQAFYPLYELFFLAALALAAQRFFAAPRPRWFAWCGVWACGLVLTRSLFHPLWVAVLWWIGRGAWSQRGMSRWAVAALVVLCAWPAKNLAEFGFFGSSSWLGMHLAHGFDVERPEVGPAFDLGDAPENRRARQLAAALVPHDYRGIPALAEPLKWPDRPDIPNLNHFAMIDYGRSLLRRVAALLRDRPLALLARASVCYRRGLCLYPGRNANTGRLDSRVPGTWMEPWVRLHEAVTVVYIGDDAIERPANGFRVLLPVMLLAVLWGVVRRRDDPHWRLVVLLLWHVLWVIAMVLVVDGFEGNRMRFSTTPLLTLIVAWALEGFLDRGARWRRVRAGEPAPTLTAG